MLTVHHLGVSQSERIVWLCEELAIPYELVVYQRDPVTRFSPPALVALHPMGAAPVITDGELTLAESGAIVEYIINIYGGGRLALPPGHPDYAQYLYWFHFSNANLQAVLSRSMVVNRLQVPPENPVAQAARGRLHTALSVVEARLEDHPFLAGSEFTAADIMVMFSLTTMKSFYPVDLSAYPQIRAYLHRLAERPAYQRAMAIGDPGMQPMLP